MKFEGDAQSIRYYYFYEYHIGAIIRTFDIVAIKGNPK